MPCIEKVVLDACCGGRQFWFDKQDPRAVFLDIRQERKGVIKLQPNFEVAPQTLGSYSRLPFKDNTFRLVVWDIPHILGKKINGIIQRKYGFLDRDTYEEDLKMGFQSIMRVLKPEGILEFKYADVNIPVKEMLDLFPIKPLFGTITKKGVNNCFWFCFMKEG